MEENILSAVSTVGFPIVLTYYLSVRFQTTMDKFCDKLDVLRRNSKASFCINDYHNPPAMLGRME